MLLFLHGFLGQKEDWEPLLSYLPASMGKAIDLPLTAEDIALAIKKQIPKASCLIGYSAGGRIALELKARFPDDYGRVIALSAHPGLSSEEEKQTRWKIDQEWISMLKSAPFEHFLQKWYCQELFTNLKKCDAFDAMLARRKNQNPLHLAQFLERNSIAKKKRFEIFPNTIFAHGKEDLKYEKLYRRLTETEKIFTIEKASHAVHLENPQACAKIIQGVLDEHY